MKRLLFLSIMLAAHTLLHAATADTLTVRIKGMKCDECAHKVGKVLRQLPGIEAISYNLERRTATIAYDAALTCPDSLRARLKATGRFAPSDYNASDVIRRGFGLRIEDMHCQNCYNRISTRLQQIEGIDSMAPHLDKHYIFIRYDANRTCKAAIRQAIGQLGYTPINYYSGPKVDYAYYLIPAEQATQETIDEVLILDGVEDVNVSQRNHSLAVTFFTDETNADKLYEQIVQAGIQAEVPKPHVCKEKQPE